ncbi:MAG: gamma carbonic anhydrase family protein [Rhodospirillaceae bacterium]|nr:MAG: gamma carbonic anhydrase family protein [Rhodospirillaceae bacterium]
MASPLIIPWNGVWPRIAADAFIAPNATIIGDVEIGAQSSIWFNVVVRGDVSHIRIGARTNLQDNTVVHVTSAGGKGGASVPTIIGNDVLVGHGAIIHACTIEDGSFIGLAATVLDGAVVESKGMVAAGAVVSPGKRVPSGELWAGTPAKFMRKLTDADFAHIKRGTSNYVEVGNLYRRQLKDHS